MKEPISVGQAVTAAEARLNIIHWLVALTRASDSLSSGEFAWAIYLKTSCCFHCFYSCDKHCDRH